MSASTDRPTEARSPRLACRLGMLALCALLALTLAGCGKKKTDAQLANESLQAGLKAHAAGKLQEAIADYNAALSHDPRNKFAYYNLGLIAQTQGDVASAENDYRLTLSIDPDYVPALYNLAILRTNAGDPTEAIQLYQHAIQVEPSNADAHLNLGFLLIAAEKKKNGQAELATAVQLDPSLSDRIPQNLAVPSGGTEPSGSKASPSPST